MFGRHVQQAAERVCSAALQAAARLHAFLLRPRQLLRPAFLSACRSWAAQPKLVPTVIVWAHGGNHVELEGSFDNWTQVRAVVLWHVCDRRCSLPLVYAC